MSDLREDCGIHLAAKINVISDSSGMQAQVSYSFGVAKLPTRAEVNAAIREAIAQANAAAKVDDFRVTNMSDFGFARTPQLEWDESE